MQLKKSIEQFEKYVITAIESDFPLKVDSVEDAQPTGKDLEGVVKIKGAPYYFYIKKAQVPHPTLQRLVG
jgi:hypothetical protein